MKKALNHLSTIPKFLGMSLIRGYQLIARPLLPNSCRFYPSCSEYTRQAINKHGLIIGTLLGMRRISKCHPGHPGGVDEVPDRVL
jgi:putative membrane protein insertion efficiency factor